MGQIKWLAPGGVDHIVEVAFDANIHTDVAVLAQGGWIAMYAANNFTPQIPFWMHIFSNARIFFVGSDDVPLEAKLEAAQAINRVLKTS